MVRRILRRFLRSFCDHRYRASRTWPGMRVCERCGHRTLGDL